MSSKGDDERFSIDKVRNQYPSITVENRSANLKSSIVSSPSTTTPSPPKISGQQSIVSNAGDRNVDTKLVPSKQVTEKRIIPPYTSCPNLGSNLKPNVPIEPTANIVRKKCGSSTSVSESAPLHNSSRITLEKNNISLSLVNKSEKPNQTLKTTSEKPPLITYIVPSNNCNSNLPTVNDPIKQLSSSLSNDAFERNIQTKALTVYNITNQPSQKEKKPGCSFGKTIKNQSNADLFKPFSKSVIPRPTTAESNNKIIATKYNICGTSLQRVSKPDLSTTSASESSKNIQSKSMVNEPATSLASKQQLSVIPSSSENVGNVTESASNTPVKQTTTSQSTPRVLKPAIATSISPISTTQTIHKILRSLNDSTDKKNEFFEALNSGTNVNVNESVTMSKASSSAVVVVQPSVPNRKNKVGSTTEVTQNPSVSSSTSATGNPRKSGNVCEKSNLSETSGADTSQEISSSSMADLAKYDSSTYFISSDETEANEERVSTRKNPLEEPECLTISSDEEAEENESFADRDIPVSVLSKEPSLEETSMATDGSVSERDEENALDVTHGEGYVSLNCRTVRIGTFKLSPRLPVVLSKYGLRIVIHNNSSSENVLKIPCKEIKRVLIHFDKPVPVIFYYVTPEMGVKVRRSLQMADPDDAYFDPCSENESQRRITLLPDNITENNKLLIYEIFKDKKLMQALNHEEANNILVRSVPKEVQKVIKAIPDPVQTIMVFPPPPAKGGISINTEDYACLARDVFLNDVIIDFYLKYLYLHHLSEEDRSKTHIFSSFFYKRLTDKATPMPRQLKSSGNVITAADIRHSRVKNWTKNIDIFSKDYIVIPLNENQHWFLAIICFPGLKGPVRFSDDTPIEEVSKRKNAANPAEGTSATADSAEKPSVTITAIKPEAKEKTKTSFADDEESEDRDEAEATDEEINISDEELDDELSCETDDKATQQSKPERVPIKQPCILIFDSLAGASRNRIIATLRDYLRVEYKIKHGENRDFSKNVVKGAVPSVPQQDNFTDCGLFVLRYVEAFFDTKIEDYHLPIKTLQNWFPPEEVSGKRYQIQQLLLALMRVQNIEVENLNLPNLYLSPSDEEDDDDDDDDEYYESDEYDDYDDGISDYNDYDVVEIQRSGSPGYHYEEENEMYDEDDEDEEMLSHSQYDIYDESDEAREMDTDEDDDPYKNLDELEVGEVGTAQFHRAMSRRMKNIVEGEDDEEEIITNECNEPVHQLSSDIEEKINNSNLNRETVSIQLTSVNSQTHSPSSSSSSSIFMNAPTVKKKETELVKLKAARPWTPREQPDDGGSMVKKFKPN